MILTKIVVRCRTPPATGVVSDRCEFNVAFESQTGNALVVYDATGNSSDLNYRTWNGVSWSSQQTLAAPIGAHGDNADERHSGCDR